MKKLALLVMVLTSTAFAGTPMGDKINFQKESTWVSASYSKSLCFDGTNFRAKIKKCTQTVGESGLCVAYATVNAVQPKYSTRTVCAQETRNGCLSYKTVDYVQSENRKITIEAERGAPRTARISVRSCN